MAAHQEVSPRGASTHQEGGPAHRDRSSTTSFLTATTLIYAIGAGITAAAGLGFDYLIIIIIIIDYNNISTSIIPSYLLMIHFLIINYSLVTFA